MTMPMPFAAGGHRLSMGLMAVTPADWILVDDDYAPMIAAKAQLMAERGDELFLALPEALPAAEELLALVVAHLAASGHRHAAPDPALHPLDAAGRLVQDDLCLLQRGPEAYRLTGGSVCFPSRWRLADKLGLPLTEIHGPTPGYDTVLARPVDRLFDRLVADKPVARVNWGFDLDAELPQFDGHNPPDLARSIPAAEIGRRLWLRSERQTLRRLPRSGAVVFTIRILKCPLEAMAGDREALERLSRILETLPPDFGRYKGVHRFGEPLAAWLADRLAHAVP